jgi:hypothetical protein
VKRYLDLLVTLPISSLKHHKPSPKSRATMPSVSPLTEIPLAGLGLGVGSLASPTPHRPRSSPTPLGSHLRPGNHSPPHRSADHRRAVPVNPSPLRSLDTCCSAIELWQPPTRSLTAHPTPLHQVFTAIYSYLNLPSAP